MYLLLALAAAAAYGAADFLGGIASRLAPIVPVLLVSQSAALVLAAAMAPMLGNVPHLADLAWGAAAGFAYAIGLLLLYRALATGRMNVVAPITGVCAPSLPVLYGLLIGEKPGWLAIVGIVLAVLAILLISRNGEPKASRADDTANRAERTVMLMAIGAGVAIGFFFIALARTPSGAGLWPLLATRAVAVLCYLGTAVLTKQPLRLPRLPLRGGGGGGGGGFFL
jgi:drug/metabolite transporter (DMT)-like permease